MSVLFLMNSFREGGTERQALQLARHLEEDGRFRVHIATLSADGALAPLVERLQPGAVLEYPFRSFYGLQMLWQLARCVAFIRRHQIQIVHTHGFYSNVFGMLAAALARTPVRIASKRETIGCRTRWQERAERIAFRLAHAVVVNCEAVRTQLIAAGVSGSRVVTIYNGVELGRITPQTRERGDALATLGLPSSPALKYVTLVANLRLRVKDHATFLRSAQRVRLEIPEARFLIAGDGALLPEMRSFAAQGGLGADAIFLGNCSHIAELLFISDVCVLSSVGEGFPNAVLEYMAAGRPVVATDVGGIAEAADDGHTAHLVPPGDEVSMADAIITLLRDPQRAREMGARARDAVLEKFSAARQRAQTLSLYESELRRARIRFEPASDTAAATPRESPATRSATFRHERSARAAAPAPDRR